MMGSGGPSGTTQRRRLREALGTGRLLRFPGAFSPLVARVIEDQGWDGVYVSGAAMAAELALPDIGLLTLTEVAQRGRQIARATTLPCLIDIDTGFGEALHVARAVREMEDAGLAGCHLEDQVAPKRCGHLDHSRVISTEEMCRKISAAVQARRDDDFVIIARTDARAVEGLDSAVARAEAYAAAGADVIFPEALTSEREFETVGQRVEAPLLANMTEFGRSPLLEPDQLSRFGYNIVIYPVTSLRLAMGAVDEGLAHLQSQGSQRELLDRMQRRERLYELVRYADYGAFDERCADFDHGT